MSVLVIGISHHTAPLDVLERCALGPADAIKLAGRLVATDAINEATVLATCNRLEVYAEVTSFHGGLTDIAEQLQQQTGLSVRDLSGHLFAHHGDEAIRHLFTVACGLDSMALGESQVLGQVREMLTVAQREGTVGRVLDPLLQRALRVGKRAFSETNLSHTGHSLIGQALEHAAGAGIDLRTARCLVVGAGAMSSLAATTLARAGVGALVIANRSPERASRLAAAVDARAVLLSDRTFLDELGAADIVVTCTGATGVVLTLQRLVEASQRRAVAAGGTPPPQLVIDLALPHDVAPEAGDLPGITLVGLAQLHEELSGLGVGEDLAAARSIIDSEVEAQLQQQRIEQATPAVVALRTYVEEVADAELERLRGRLGDIDERTMAEVERAVHRVVDKLLHRPTVRVKALAAEDGGSRYAQTLAELFDLSIETTGGTSIHDLSQALAVEVVRQ